jgi:hypothetical protein
MPNAGGRKRVDAPIDESTRTLVRELIAERGERQVLILLCVCRDSLGRALAGLPVRRGTAALIAQGLLRADAASPQPERSA